MKKIKIKLANTLNNKSSKLLNTYYIFVFIPFIIFFSMYATIISKTNSISSLETTSMIDINKGWKNKDGKEININPLISNKNIKKGKTYTIYHKIPKETKVGDSLCFRGLSTDINIYIDDKQIINTPYREHIFSCKSPGDVWYFYTFKEKDLGKTMKLTVNPCYNDTSCYIDNMYIGSSTTYIQRFIEANIVPIIVALLILFLGIVYIIIDLYVCINQKIYKHSLLYIGIFSILIAIWSILATHVVDFIPGFSQPVQFIACILLYIIPGGALLFTKSNFSKEDTGYKIVNLTLIITLILYTLAMFLQVTELSDLHETLYLSHICIITNCLSIIVICISIHKSTKKDKVKNHKKDSPVINITFTTIIFLILILCFIADIVIFYSSSSSNIGMFTRIAALFLILYLGILAFQNLYNLDKDATHAKFVQKLAYTDGLTGINNRTSFQERLTYLNENITNYKQIGIISFDVNNLKVVNDTLGHAIGDELIIAASNVIKQSFEEFATIYRIGGDEFVALIEKNNAEAIYKVCSLQFNVNIQNYNNFYSKPYSLSIAYGSAFYYENTKQPILEILKQSDDDMYKNKLAQKKKI